jgi:arabinose-5-phosphate isomerase
MPATHYQKFALEVFAIESKSVADLGKWLTPDFDKVISLILKNKGRVVVSGVGKSGVIGKKIAATLSSTGTSSLFMHPVEAFHGDLGMLAANDVFIGISYSGETEEIIKLIPYIKSQKIKSISITGHPKSTLAANSDFHLNVFVEKEACPLELAPTSSTTATLAMGDAIAVSLMKARKFKPENFAVFHPGGRLGRKLLTTVAQEMFSKNLPVNTELDKMENVIGCISQGRLGLTIICKNKNVVGIITDGDLRRAMQKHKNNFFNLTASDIMTVNPKFVSKSMKLSEAEEYMNVNKITTLLVCDKNKLEGVLQIYSLNK